MGTSFIVVLLNDGFIDGFIYALIFISLNLGKISF